MATHIQDTLDLIDDKIAGYAEGVFATFGAEVATMLQAMGVVGICFIGANAALQFAPVRMADYLKWSVRYVAITAVATSWAQFQPFYDILTNTPGAIGAELLGATGAPNLNVALDEMITELFYFSEVLADESAFYSISLMSFAVWLIGALMACVAIIVAALGKVGLAMAVSFAPVFLTALMFKATSNLFEAWAKFAIGFALIPLVLAGVMGAIVGIGQEMIDEAGGAAELSEAAGFIIVGVAAIFLMIQVPTLVNGLAGSIVATADGPGMAARAARGGASAASAGQERARPVSAAVTSALGAARTPDPGASRIQSLMRDWERNAKIREERSRAFREREAERGQLAPGSAIRAAGRAGVYSNAKSRGEARDARRSGPDVTDRS